MKYDIIKSLTESENQIEKANAFRAFENIKNLVKNEHKELAKEIREAKNKRKTSMYGYVSGLYYDRQEYRHKHVAYCIFFNNTPYEKIEANPKEPLSSKNKFADGWKRRIKEEFGRLCNENVCVSA